jgi:hypothetical protein
MIRNHNLGNQLHGILGNFNMFFDSTKIMHSDHTYIYIDKVGDFFYS